MNPVIRVFNKIDRNLREVDALLYCAGPGSTLGLRIAATFCRTILWNSNDQVKLFDYNALDLAALLAKQPERTIQAPLPGEAQAGSPAHRLPLSER